MAGNSQRRGAVRKSGTKKGMVVGSGGQRRRGLEGKGPTPKAEDRPYHKAHRRAGAAGAAGKGKTSGGGGSQSRPQSRSTSRRQTNSTEVVTGRNAVVEALREGVPVTTLFISGRVDDERIREAVTLATERGIPVLEAPKAEMDRITDGLSHQGIAAKVPPYEYADINDLLELNSTTFSAAAEMPLVVALDGITDPRNLGAIIRSVAAFGGHGVVVPERRSAGVTASAWKTSAGAAARIPVAAATNLTRALEQFRAAGYFVVGLDMGADVELPGLPLATEPLVVVVGSEGKGLSRLVRENCDQIVGIPMAGRMESLNASVACGVALYEVARMRSESESGSS
ncbi:MAG: 23S rRNA (guanosine(2251)-2'-O)-methyltransferase RlmB [Dermatophilus congolensis]|nr:23S rRNA (guanosine(2251)-2'-O)-methyltransferase RlmB [Dermatophilus congolensis]